MTMLFLAQNLPAPDPNHFWQWILAAAAILWIVSLLKDIFMKVPPDHQRWADRQETNQRLKDLEDHVSQIKKQASEDKEDLIKQINAVPAQTIALLKEMKGLL